MCGIAGFVNVTGKAIEGRLLLRMNDKLRHRGPDDEGYVLIQRETGRYVEFSGHDSPRELRDAYPLMSGSKDGLPANIGLGHRRFAIIDLTVGGHQPFFDSDRTCCVVFNGEIYNYLEVRDQLIKMGHIFRSASDTEVIVEAYKAWGMESFNHFNGMWALALYDFNRRVLIVSRDRLGKAPLYWTKRSDTIYFASEIKALLEVPEVERTISVNEDTIYPYLVYGLRDIDNSTFFAGIYTMPAASWAVLTEDFPGNIQRYWQVPKHRLRESDITVPEAAAAVRDTLEDAVRIRMRADVPWCVALSGGMDSSALVALASPLSGKRLITCTVRFPEKEWNEEPFARSLASYYGTDYRVVDSPLANFWREILPFTYLEEEPYHSPNLHTEQVVRRIMRSEGIKMLLNGAAGDELFAGYSSYYWPAQMENLLTGRLTAYFDNGARWSENHNPITALARPAARLLRSVIKEKVLPESWIEFLKSLRSSRNKGNYVKVAPASANGRYFHQTLTETLYSDITNTLLPYWLRSGDKTHMGIPMETRAPFLDFRMVQLAFSLPVTYLIRHGWHKWILRQALRDILPKDVLWRRKKMGFPFPYGRFFSTSQPVIQTIFRQSRNPFVDLSSRSDLGDDWRLISFLLWYELFFNRDGKLFSKISKESPTVIHDAESGFAPEFLSCCAVANG